MRRILFIIMTLFAVSSAFAADIPGGVIPRGGSLVIEIGELPPLKGGYTIHCKMTNSGDQQRLYVDVVNETKTTQDMLTVRSGKNAFYFSIEGTRHGRVGFYDYTAPDSADPIVVKSCRIHASPNN